jgi:hypothetical protein
VIASYWGKGFSFIDGFSPEGRLAESCKAMKSPPIAADFRLAMDRQRTPHQSLAAAPGTTVSATSIANEFTEALGDLYTSSLITVCVLLSLMGLTVIDAAQLMLLRLDRRAMSSV